VRPVVHWSESQEGRKPHAHSDFVEGPLRLYGLTSEVDVMIESKAKELALLRLRDPTYRPSAAVLAAAIGNDEGAD
jgi:UV DNA damage endonuclease